MCDLWIVDGDREGRIVIDGDCQTFWIDPQLKMIDLSLILSTLMWHRQQRYNECENRHFKSCLDSIQCELKAHLAYHVAPLRLGFVPRDKRRQAHGCCVSKRPCCVLQGGRVSETFLFCLGYWRINHKVTNQISKQPRMTMEKKPTHKDHMRAEVNTCAPQILSWHNILKTIVSLFGSQGKGLTDNTQWCQ